MTAVRPKAAIEGFRSETVTVNGVRLHYWIGGDPDGRPVILWHGLLSTGYEWREVAPVLAPARDDGARARRAEMVGMVAADVRAETLPGCGHFVPEECPNTVIRGVLGMAAKLRG